MGGYQMGVLVTTQGWMIASLFIRYHLIHVIVGTGTVRILPSLASTLGYIDVYVRDLCRQGVHCQQHSGPLPITLDTLVDIYFITE